MNDKPLNSKIASWIDSQGYEAEMRVARTLYSAGFQTIQSLYYDDPESGASREIDVVARLTDPVGLLQIYSIIECKKSSRPWVVFTSEQALYNRILSFAIMNEESTVAVINNTMKMLGVKWFEKPGRVAYGATEAFKSQGDAVFKAAMAATKASISILLRETIPKRISRLSYFFPTIVLEGQLFECCLNQDGKANVSEIDSTFLLFPLRIAGQTGASIRIVTIDVFNRYCNDILSLYQSLEDALSTDIANIANSLNIPVEETD